MNRKKHGEGRITLATPSSGGKCLQMYTDDLNKAERRWRERSLFKPARPRRRVATTLVVVVLLTGATLALAQWGGLDVFALVNP